MGFYRAARTVADSSGRDLVDWQAAAESAKSLTEPGDLALSPGERGAYAADVRAARDRIRTVAGVEFEVPDAIEVMSRHHWIDAAIPTFRRVLDRLDARSVGPMAGLARTVNTGSMAVSLSFLANNVLGQYDPLLLADASVSDHRLYVVHPNVQQVARELELDEARFRRWIAFHEIAHAAEFGAAPWLTDHIEAMIEETVADLSDGRLRRQDLAAIDTAMTAVEGYAELLMDRAFDEEYEDLRRRLDERRANPGLLTALFRRLLGISRKRRQYERGKAFFEAVVDATDVRTAGLVWEAPANLPTDAEFDQPERWLARMGIDAGID
jgi:uncharacterized protein (DUF2342 family)